MTIVALPKVGPQPYQGGGSITLLHVVDYGAWVFFPMGFQQTGGAIPERNIVSDGRMIT